MIDELQPGELLDHYRLRALVAHTGMASVFRGIDLTTGLTVAVKVPDPYTESDPVFFSRFQREAEIGKKLDHPGVVKMLTNGNQSRPYLVMEWIEGRSLRKVLDEEGKMPSQRAVLIACGICDALEYIHDHGVVHRDLKPDNVMLGADDSVKLFDFGIASLVGARRLTFSKFTPTLGTPDYISPEQIRGKRGDARSDLYALGAMLYEMLTGKAPFNGPNAFAIMHDRLLNPPIPPREIDPTISPELQEVIYRALERDPKNRYARAQELARDLRHLDHVGVTERPEFQDWKDRRSPGARRVLSYVFLAMIPIVIFALLLLVARQR